MFDEILQYFMNNISTTLQAWKWYLVHHHLARTVKMVPNVVPTPEMQMRSNGDIEYGEGSQINKAGQAATWRPDI